MKNSGFFLLLFVAGMARGQDVMNRQQWDAVEGLYQLTGNANMFLRFTDRDGELVARFLWDATAEVHFLPDSGLVFHRKDEGEDGRVHIRFRKDEEGRVVHVTMGNGTEWDRSSRVVMQPERLKALTGIYQSKEEPHKELTVVAGDSSLMVKQTWDGRQTVVVPLSETFFYTPDQFYTVVILPHGKRNSPREIRLMNQSTFKLIEK